jgi:ACR3 family arsenite transporter
MGTFERFGFGMIAIPLTLQTYGISIIGFIGAWWLRQPHPTLYGSARFFLI